jgi:hypothetical protein
MNGVWYFFLNSGVCGCLTATGIFIACLAWRSVLQIRLQSETVEVRNDEGKFLLRTLEGAIDRRTLRSRKSEERNNWLLKATPIVAAGLADRPLEERPS